MVGQPNDDDGRSDFSAYSVPIIKRPFFKFGEISISKNSQLCLPSDILLIFKKLQEENKLNFTRTVYVWDTVR